METPTVQLSVGSMPSLGDPIFQLPMPEGEAEGVVVVDLRRRVAVMEHEVHKAALEIFALKLAIVELQQPWYTPIRRWILRQREELIRLWHELRGR